MPIYEYACENCGHVTEALRRMAQADEPVACEQCGAKQTRRAQSVFAAGAASGGAGEQSMPMGCGRCGDPNGSCGI